MVTRFKLLVALISFSVTIATAVLGPWAIRLWLAREPATPPVEDWPKIQLIVDPTLHCPAPVTTGRLYSWTIDAVVAENGRRFVHMELPNGYGGERFELAFLPISGGKFEVGALGRKTVDYGPPFKHVLNDLQGVVTVNTLDWREREPIHVRCDLSYYDTEASRCSSIDVSSQATPTREQ